MKQIESILKDLGAPYQIRFLDKEPCIYRRAGEYEFEVSGTHSGTCTLYVWTISPRRIVAQYDKIPTEDLKDVLGYFACIYRKLPGQFQAVYQETIK